MHFYNYYTINHYIYIYCNSCCCCCSSGTVRLISQCDKTAYTPQETVRVIAEVDNSNVSKDINKIKIQLRQHILLNRNEKNIGYFTEDKTFSYSETILEKEFEGIGEKQRTNGMERDTWNSHWASINTLEIKASSQLRLKTKTITTSESLSNRRQMEDLFRLRIH